MRPLFSFSAVSLALVLGSIQSSLAVPNPRGLHLSAMIPRLKDSILPPRHWIDLGPAPPTEVITLRIGLPQARFSELERQLYEISDPRHERYGQHLMKEQVDELVRPDPRSVEAVDAWLVEHGIPEGGRIQRSRAGDWVTILVPIAQAEQMLHTEFHLWKHTRDGHVLIRTTHYSLPEDLHAHIELVQPTTYFGRPKPMSTKLIIKPLNINLTISLNPTPPPPGHSYTDPRLNVSCTDVITVFCLQQLYNTSGYNPAATNKNSIGINGFDGQFANQADLQSFYNAEVPAAVNSSFNTILVNGGQNDQTLSNAGPEADLDTQFALGLSFPTPGTFFSTGGSPPFNPDVLTPANTNEPYDDWLHFMLGLRDGAIPQTITTSYSDDEQTVPVAYATRVCQEFANLGSRGASIIFSSGDGGVGDGNPDPSSQQCFSNDGTNRTKFIPQFPPSCPFVTAVGGTTGIPEVAAFFSGGGFSNYFARPSYQNDAVSHYLGSLPSGQYRGLFNSSGRAYPDVSAQSENFLIWLSGTPVLISGTSASAPAFAGVIALLNDAMLAAGKPPLGFLNPLLYGAGAAGMNDITVGNAPGCGTPGFNATKGWDPVTGLGTPDFLKLKNIFLNYPLGGLLGGLLGALAKTLSLSVDADLTVTLL